MKPSKAINYVDLTSLGLSLGKNSIYVLIAVFVIVFGGFLSQILSIAFYTKLIVSYPVGIEITRSETTLNKLKKEFLNCFGQQIIHQDVSKAAVVNILVHNRNPKTWRFFNCPNGIFKSLQVILEFFYNYGTSTEQNEVKLIFLNKTPLSKLTVFPKLKVATDIEPRLRFLQAKKI
ncbi:MAG: hypothetical protein EZS28_020329 [Streblomastix strix]|uniref:Uncharacterized protein n=1 Tax=Streblomastix strix TaxID=222440 RepID=A0A5J4VNQ8_9EUKA|nr:MAG: hypothetical protein EZS28_020329 [Streblomastix strix]